MTEPASVVSIIDGVSWPLYPVPGSVVGSKTNGVWRTSALRLVRRALPRAIGASLDDGDTCNSTDRVRRCQQIKIGMNSRATLSLSDFDEYFQPTPVDPVQGSSLIDYVLSRKGWETIDKKLNRIILFDQLNKILLWMIAS